MAHPKKVNILFLTNALGIGGAEKNILYYWVSGQAPGT